MKQQQNDFESIFQKLERSIDKLFKIISSNEKQINTNRIPRSEVERTLNRFNQKK